MIRTAFRRTFAIVFVAALFMAPIGAGEPIRGVLLEGEDDVLIKSHAQQEGWVALVGERFDFSTFWSNPFIAVFNEQTGEEIWRDEEGPSVFRTVAIAQGRVCAAGVPGAGAITSAITIRCYRVKDGTLLWSAAFDHPKGNVLIRLDHSSLSLSGKALVLRVDANLFLGDASFAILLDPSDGSAK